MNSGLPILAIWQINILKIPFQMKYLEILDKYNEHSLKHIQLKS